jgi:branched-chain amino acid transport system permease protein
MATPLRVQRYTRTSRVALPVAAVVVIAAATIPAWGSSNIMKQGVTFLTLVALAQMWNLLAGYAGLISVGQQAFVGIGAYSLWVFAEKVGINPFLCVPIAGLVAALFALPTAALAFRLRGGYFAVGTWVIAEVYRLLVTQTSWLGGGSGVMIKSAGQVQRSTREAVIFWLALAVAVGSVALVYFLLRSRRGLALTAIRDEETGARGLGVNVFRSKLWVYVIAAFGTGVIGAVIYLNLLRVTPEASFGLNWSTLMIFAVVIGGLGTIEGPIIGAVIFFALQQLLSDYGTWYLILIGALAALVVVFARRGLWGSLVYRRAIDLFPVRRRLCLETVCFPEEASPSEPAVRGAGEGDAPDLHVSSETAPPAPTDRQIP